MTYHKQSTTEQTFILSVMTNASTRLDMMSYSNTKLLLLSMWSAKFPTSITAKVLICNM